MAFQRGEDGPEAYVGALMTADYQLHVVAFIDGWSQAAKRMPKRKH